MMTPLRAWALVLASLSLVVTAFAAPSSGSTSTSSASTPHKKTSPYAKGAMPDSAKAYYAVTWGVDQLSVKLAESGQLVRFSYRVVDATKAKLLQDKAANPNLLDEATHAVLVIPTMEKVGPLRQSMVMENGKSYWMAFSNKGNIVKAGHRVSIVIGAMRFDGLIVQ